MRHRSLSPRRPGRELRQLRLSSLTNRCGPHTIAYMKDAVLTIRLPARTRKHLEVQARKEGRSLSAQAERFIEQGMARGSRLGLAIEGPRPLAGILIGGAVPNIDDFRAVRKLLSTSLLGGRTRLGAKRRR